MFLWSQNIGGGLI